MELTKRCTSCGENKSISFFYKCKSGLYEKKAICKYCCKIYKQDSYDPIKKSIQSKKWRDNNKEKCAQMSKKTWDKNREKYNKQRRENRDPVKIAAQSNRYRVNNRERYLKLSLESYHRNKERILKKKRQAYQEDPEPYRERGKLNSQISVKNISDRYVKQLLVSNSSIPRFCISYDLINLKRTELQMTRYLKDLKQ
jgi:hypothetical protein